MKIFVATFTGENRKTLVANYGKVKPVITITILAWLIAKGVRHYSRARVPND